MPCAVLQDAKPQPVRSSENLKDTLQQLSLSAGKGGSLTNCAGWQPEQYGVACPLAKCCCPQNNLKCYGVLRQGNDHNTNFKAARRITCYCQSRIPYLDLFIFRGSVRKLGS